jgi:hypothetical protein
MRELYGLAELHWELRDLHRYIRRNGEVPEFSSLNKKLEETYEKRRKKIQKFLQKYNPRVVFTEGTSYYFYEIEDTGYEGKIISLDEHSENYRKFIEGENLIHSKYIPLYEKFMSRPFSEIKIKYCEIIKNHKNEIASYFVKNYKMLKTDREREWAQVISDYYEFPSCIIAGAYHLMGDLNNDLKILVNSLPYITIHIIIPGLLDRYRKLNETLTYFLKQKGIKLKVNDCLFIF